MRIFLSAFEGVPDPRASDARHDLGELLVIAFVPGLCGSSYCAEMAAFGRAKEPLFRGFLKLKHTIPSHDTFTDVFRMIDPRALDAAFGKVLADVAAFLQDGDVIAIDGKVLRRARDKSEGARTRMTVSPLSRTAASDAGHRSRGSRRGTRGCDRSPGSDRPAREGRDRRRSPLQSPHGRDHQRPRRRLVPGPEGQPAVASVRCTRMLRRQGRPRHQATTEESSHGRRETRTATVVSAKSLADHHEFPELKAFGRIEATREVDRNVSSETRWFALSWQPEPNILLAIVRDHRGIENALHWQLDVSFSADTAADRKDNAKGNIAVLRRRALDVVRQDTSKSSLSIKLKRAGWDEGCLRSILANRAKA
jgi:predicted transposase YbfD/YdcC